MTKIIETKSNIEFGPAENNLISSFLAELDIALKQMINTMIIHQLNIDGITYKIGFTKTLYKYRNELSEFIISLNNPKDIDMVGIIMTDTPTVSYRSVKNVDVSRVAVYFGGKGHHGAGSNLQTNHKFNEILNLFK